MRNVYKLHPGLAEPFLDYLAPLLKDCPRCGGVGCKECADERDALEYLGYVPNNLDMKDEDMNPDIDDDDEDDEDMDDDLEPDDDDDMDDDEELDDIRLRKQAEDESFARRLAMGVSMLAEGDDSILDD